MSVSFAVLKLVRDMRPGMDVTHIITDLVPQIQKCIDCNLCPPLHIRRIYNFIMVTQIAREFKPSVSSCHTGGHLFFFFHSLILSDSDNRWERTIAQKEKRVRHRTVVLILFRLPL